MPGRHRRLIRPGETYTVDELDAGDVELEDVEPDPEGTVPGEEFTPAEPEPPGAEDHAAGWPAELGGEG
jgi:hypothetical protein